MGDGCCCRCCRCCCRVVVVVVVVAVAVVVVVVVVVALFNCKFLLLPILAHFSSGSTTVLADVCEAWPLGCDERWDQLTLHNGSIVDLVYFLILRAVRICCNCSKHVCLAPLHPLDHLLRLISWTGVKLTTSPELSLGPQDLNFVMNQLHLPLQRDRHDLQVIWFTWFTQVPKVEGRGSRAQRSPSGPRCKSYGCPQYTNCTFIFSLLCPLCILYKLCFEIILHGWLDSFQ